MIDERSGWVWCWVGDVDAVSGSASMAVDSVWRGLSRNNLMASFICSTAIAMVVLSDSISAFRNMSSLAVSSMLFMVVVGVELLVLFLYEYHF